MRGVKDTYIQLLTKAVKKNPTPLAKKFLVKFYKMKMAKEENSDEEEIPTVRNQIYSYQTKNKKKFFNSHFTRRRRQMGRPQ
jgi:hypothetical protein